ncbi:MULTISPECIES: RNA-guided endonuclease InsQ/TnpB family protein [Rhodococcus]|uniref:RNA-guided endonuclease InsQ/TnpB family protein n=1 Tax=Rhodococcus TaxID=1827 RepID=UPI00057495EB|nr:MULTISPECIES: RNA-guided endonuclease TnpB family protein [Rhodococcus]KHJ73580.1 transposase [Rhodococcus sp. Chr-9]MCW3470724.1 transposase [Rhodococcus pyridinivorans]
MGVEVVRYNFRLRAGSNAERALLDEWHRCRFLWNEAVHLQKTGARPTSGKLSKQLTETRRRSAWLRAGSQVAQQQTLRTYARALDSSFAVKGRNRPKFKSRKATSPTLEYTRRSFRIQEGRLRLPKGVTIPVVWSRKLPSEPSSVRITRDSVGDWYASFVVTRSTEPPAPAPPGSAIGVDWGVTHTATTTDERFDLPHRGHRKRCAAELAKAQRTMARRRRPKGSRPSNGYRRARKRASQVQKKAARRNQHEARMWARGVVAHHALIAVEDFRPQLLARSTMARKAADAAIGAAKRELAEQGTRAGRKVVLVRPAYTTMTCSRCFARAKQRLELGERTFRCSACDYSACRDRNAARVILAVAERGHTGVDDVRQADHLLGGSVAVRAGNLLPSGRRGVNTEG